jgi:hypothetical protein
MVAYSIAQRLTPNLALAGAGAAGVLVTLATLAIPYGLLETLVVTSGIAAFIPAAEPPLGVTARICVGVFAGGATALVAWFVLSALLMWRESRGVQEEGERRPVVRRADAHPDAPPRAPLLATRDLGMPFRAQRGNVDSEEIEADARVFVPEWNAEEGAVDVGDLDLPELPPEPVIAMGVPMPPQVEPTRAVSIAEVNVEAAPPPAPQPLPADLDQPLSAFDPGAILEVPRAPPQPLTPLNRTPLPPALAEGERFETFELTPPVRVTPAPEARPVPRPENLSAPETDASVHALLDRLERGIARRTHAAPEAAPVQQQQAEPAAPAPEPTPDPGREPLPPGLEGALAALRKMAVRA